MDNNNIYMDNKVNQKLKHKVEEIINSEIVLNKFMDYENNKEYFYNIPLTSYLNYMDELVTYYECMDEIVPEQLLMAFTTIMSKYSLQLKKEHVLTGVRVRKELNKEFETHILSKVNLKEDSFSIARSIYIELCRNLGYDENYLIHTKKGNRVASQEIYNRQPIDINLNDKVVCSPWAETYASILNKLGIEATVEGGLHKYVLVNADGTLIKADANMCYVEPISETCMCDISRVKMNLGTAGFVCIEKHKNITNDIKRVDINHNESWLNLESKKDYILNTFNTVVNPNFNETQKLSDKLSIVVAAILNSNLNGLDLMKEIQLFLRLFLEKEQFENFKPFCIARKTNELKYEPLFIFSYNDNNEYRYFLFNGKSNMIEMDKENVQQLFNDEDLETFDKGVSIPGLNKPKQKKFSCF